MASATSACLIEDPPPYTEPQQTPPRLDLRRAAPLIDQVILGKVGDTVQFTVPVASEDAGDDLDALLLLNSPAPSPYPYIAGADRLKAGTLDDTGREISIPWIINSKVPAGCQRLTLVVSHRLNFISPSSAELEDKADQAVAVWWANISPPPGEAMMLVDCPLATTTEGN